MARRTPPPFHHLSKPHTSTPQSTNHSNPFHKPNYSFTPTTLHHLKQIHAQILTTQTQTPILTSTLITHYANLTPNPPVLHLLHSTPHKDVFLWNLAIRHTPPSTATALYTQMLQLHFRPNNHTYTFALKACASSDEYQKGRNVHSCVVKCGFERDRFVGNSLLAFYSRFGEVCSARKVFDGITHRDLVSWNSMVGCYGRNGCAHDAICVFRRMLGDGYEPDRFTLVSVLSVCAKLVAVREGLWVHCYMIKSDVEVDVGLGSGLVAMYAACGRLNVAELVFSRLPERNLVVWDAMIRGYGMHGYASKAVELFLEMLETGVVPDATCFTSVLSACSHAGMMERGIELFNMMSYFGVEKHEVHYACVVDLLGRAGRLQEAFKFINNMPMEPGKDVWGAMLGACRIHNELDVAETMAERMLDADPSNAGRYVILAKMYEDAGRWEDAARMRSLMRDKRVRKPIGYSAVEVDNAMHMFGVEDESHPMAAKIYKTLEGLGRVVEDVKIAALGS